MGVNYYLHTPPECVYCGAGGEILHIGKSSFGWCFSLHVIPGRFDDLDDWASLWSIEGYTIYDENENLVSAAKMRQVITERTRPLRVTKDFDFTANDAELGPNNLLRSVIDGHHCIGHGKGTWDLIVGEFS
jgi:hypothetical protein